ncbi:ribosomal-protein-alanine N-acetyltransferase [Enhydrobacter aerosaccus]|uniref:Ribosomal-protein-alanine N-acetyltransferase n=1 Tax=Enhydrobacter aerosaccus TaxID=225324 RepID=A0A1T4R4F2_9HYPH|nr:ribosomal protein S18-alanine N-acetyltransferase [Enhydrobacter aerosaccus]SKA10766.1 ribosomal-protein-alanine N-acetyltransferase [Enhydrobacter aerosaccus]
MTAPPTCRPLGPLDLELAAALHAEAFAELNERGWTWQELADLAVGPGVFGLIAMTDTRKPVGFALCRVAADEAELLTLAVSQSCRRQGAGRALLKAVIDLVRARGANHLFLEVGADNPKAQALYQQAGFAAVGRRPGYYPRTKGPPADAIVMRLALG